MVASETDADLDALARRLWAVGDPIRLRILQILPTEPSCDNVCNVSKVAERIGLSQPTASHHLRVLRQAGLVANRRMCRDMLYWVRLEEADGLVATLRGVFHAPDAGGTTLPPSDPV